VWSDPVVRDKREGKKYKEMVELLRYILRQFFKCAERNKCVFVELLFRKTFEKSKEALLENRNAEFEAILANYEDEGYAQFLEKMRQGEGFDKMRQRQRQLQDGSLPWSPEEDGVLRERYAVYADHPLCMELLAAELPEDSRRTSKGVKARLAELGLLQPRGKRTDTGPDNADGAGGPEANKAENDQDSPPAKKLKTDVHLRTWR